MEAAEQESITEALKPFHNPKLRDRIIGIHANIEQVIDEVTQDALLHVGYDEVAKDKARTVRADFRKFIEDNQDEIEALQILYSRPYRSRLQYRHVKELAAAIERPPLGIHDPQKRLWQLYEAIEPEKVKGKGGSSLVDLIALVRHAIQPEEDLVPVAETVEQRYTEWIAEQESTGTSFTEDQRRWLDAIRDHIANSLSIDPDDFEYAPFSQLGGLGKAHQLFGEDLQKILDELNERLAA